jgi:hypothetical protein
VQAGTEERELFEFWSEGRVQGRIFTGLLNTQKRLSKRLPEQQRARKAFHSPSEGEEG